MTILDLNPETGMRYALSLGKTGADFTMRLTALTTREITRAVSLAANSLKKIEKIPGAHNFGNTAVKDLQAPDTGVKISQVEEKMIRPLAKELKKGGIDFALKQDADKNFYLYFKAKDTDTLEHGLKIAETKIRKKTRADLKKDIETRHARLLGNREKTPVRNRTAEKPGQTTGLPSPKHTKQGR